MSVGEPYHGYPPNGGFIGGPGVTISSAGHWSSLELDLSNNKEFQELKQKIEGIEERLAILVPNTELQERFPALQEAYNHYKVIEKLVNDQSKNRE